MSKFKISEAQAKVKKIHLRIFYGYLVLCVLYYFYHHHIRDIVQSLSNKDIANSFSASMAYSLFIFIFGLTISFLTVFYTINDPKNENFSYRVRALVNSDKFIVDDELFRYLKRHLSKNFAFYKHCEIRIEIKEYDKNKKAYLIYCDVKLSIANMCKDLDYFTETIIYVEPEVDINGDWGTVVHVESYDLANSRTLDSFYNMHKITGKVNFKTELFIPANEELGWRFCFQIWENESKGITSNDFFFYKFYKYARECNFTIVNKLKDKESAFINLRLAKFNEKTAEECKKERKIVNKRNLEENPRELYTYSYLYPEEKLVYNDSLSNKEPLECYPNDRIELFINSNNGEANEPQTN